MVLLVKIFLATAVIFILDQGGFHHSEALQPDYAAGDI